ncbi:hypothetical protein CVS40_9877 [Lucilia cuprina]|nr:hypothetical protein CVS40_9877 [Lucilia cuprina]
MYLNYRSRELHVDKILDQPNISSASASSLKDLLDTTIECIHALKAMNFNIGDADPIIARIVIRKLDKECLLLYEQSTKKSKEIQELRDVLEFLEQQYQALEASTRKRSCPYCKKSGYEIYSCKQPVTERHTWVKTNNWCYNCLKH